MCVGRNRASHKTLKKKRHTSMWPEEKDQLMWSPVCVYLLHMDSGRLSGPAENAPLAQKHAFILILIIFYIYILVNTYIKFLNNNTWNKYITFLIVAFLVLRINPLGGAVSCVVCYASGVLSSHISTSWLCPLLWNLPGAFRINREALGRRKWTDTVSFNSQSNL